MKKEEEKQMAFAPFGKKKEEPMMPPTGFAPAGGPSPVDAVLSMRSQGMSDTQIIQTLQSQGYPTNDIYDALNQSDVKMGTEQPMSAPLPPPPKQQSSFSPAHEQHLFTSDTERVEEVAEAIIDEKWKELTKNLDKILEWRDKTESRLTVVEQNMETLRRGFEMLHSSVLGKVSEYDQNIVNLGTEIKAMEKVFQKLLPTFTENVNELSRITAQFKKEKQ